MVSTSTILAACPYCASAVAMHQETSELGYLLSVRCLGCGMCGPKSRDTFTANAAWSAICTTIEAGRRDRADVRALYSSEPVRRKGHSALRAKPGGELETFDPHPEPSEFRKLFSSRYGADKLKQADQGEIYWRATYESEQTMWNYALRAAQETCVHSGTHEEATASIRRLEEPPPGEARCV